MITKKKIIFIAEIGVNHNGKLPLARRLILQAKKAGASYVKIQNYISENLVTEYAPKAKYQKNNLKSSTGQISMLRKYELKKKDYFLLKKFSKLKKIELISSVFDTESLFFVKKKLKFKIIKIPSGEITNFNLLKNLNIKKDKIIISTGMSNLKEICDALNIIFKKTIYKFKAGKVEIKNKKYLNKFKRNIAILHCVTSYPVEKKFANLNAIKELKKSFLLKTGYSDHTTGTLASLIAISRGATIIEKHITLDRNMVGPDHKASLTFKEFKSLVDEGNQIIQMMGNGKKIIQKCEIQNLIPARKSIVAKKTIIKGQRFSEKNIDTKRPGSGISASKIDFIIGKKAVKNFKKDELIILK